MSHERSMYYSIEPITKRSDLPEVVRQQLVPELQKIWMEGYNKGILAYHDKKVAAAFAWGWIRVALRENIMQQVTPVGTKGGGSKGNTVPASGGGGTPSGGGGGRGDTPVFST